jgi:hypothetical protein
MKKSRKCRYGKRKSNGRYKRKPGPKSRKPKIKSRKTKSSKKFKMIPSEYPSKFMEFFKYITSDLLYDKNIPVINDNIDTIRKTIKDLFDTKNARATELNKGSFSFIYQNPEIPNWLFRCTKVKDEHVQTEIDITLSMLNRPNERPNLTDIWSEPSTDTYGKTKIYSIVRRYKSDGATFLKSSAVNDSRIMGSFYKALYEDFTFLSEKGWECFDLKPGNILVNEPDISRNDWVRLTDFGADWCRKKTDLDDVIHPLYQPLFMLFLFQFNGRSLTNQQKVVKAFLKSLKESILENTTNLSFVISGFQQIYNFFLYLLIMPYSLIQTKYKPIQTNLLHYSCESRSRNNFTKEKKECLTFDLIVYYFQQIFKMFPDQSQLNFQSRIIQLYQSSIANISGVTPFEMAVQEYNRQIAFALFDICQDLKIPNPITS